MRLHAFVIVALLLLGAVEAAAQRDVRITPPPVDRRETPPRYAPARPGAVDAYGGTGGARHEPAFIGPTLRSDTTELGFSGWIAPGVRSGGLEPGRGTDGSAALGLTFSWGGPPQRPPAPAIP